ncbi:MAG: oligosaccharide flippase family protein [Candidatus Omnitrophica bacterium]|nr:oligosaccharide flippase family protein [Candidatus Omnitrophota bacterium]
MSKAKLLAKSSMMGTIDFIAQVLIGLYMMPFIIHSLGDKMYGLWAVVGSFMGFYGMFDFGLVIASQRYISKALGNKDYEQANKIINTSFVLFSLIGFAVLIFSLLIVIFAPYLIKSTQEIELFKKVIIIMGLSLAIGFPMRVFSGIMVSHIRHDLYVWSELIKLVVRTIFAIAALKIGYGVLALAIITAFSEVFAYAVKFIIVKKKFKYVRISRKYIDKTILKPMFGYSVFSFIIRVAQQLRGGISNFIIAGFLGLSQVTIYSIAFNLIQYFIRFISSSIGGLMIPVFSQYEGKNDYIAIREKFILVSRITGYITMLIGGVLIIFGRVFIERWVGSEYLMAYTLLVILCVPAMMNLMQNASVEVMLGISRHKAIAMLTISESIANLLLSLLLVKKYGLIGVALGYAVPTFIVRVFMQPRYVCKVIKLDLNEYYFNLLVPVLLKSTLILTTLWIVFNPIVRPKYSSLLPIGTCAGILFVAGVFFFCLNNQDRQYIKKLTHR